MSISNMIVECFSTGKLAKIIFGFFLFLNFTTNVNAAGRMHEPTVEYPTGHKYEPRQKYELCRLKKEVRKPTEVKCYYLRQDRKGADVIITNDQPTFNCLGQIQCKIE